MNLKEEWAIIKRSTEEIIPEEALLEKLKESKPLKIKWGADPTAPDIHLGHTVVLRKLKDFQDLGHEVIFLIGDFTARIGDPSGKEESRPMLSSKEIEENAKTYQEQVFKILDRKKTRVVYNSHWLENMAMQDFLKLSSMQSVARMLERNEFKERLKKGKDIRILEFIYPLLQGYDSVALEADVEIGATEQKFNLLMGRTIQRRYGQKGQVVITMPVLEGLDGKEKMSKSLGNYVGVTEPPEEIYGKLMSIPDDLILRYFTLLTSLEEKEIQKIKADLKDKKVNPKTLKERLASIIVENFHDQASAGKAKEVFDAKHKPGQSLEERLKTIQPEEKEIPSTSLKEGKIWICKLLTAVGATPSNAEARRLIQQGAVQLNEEKITDSNLDLPLPQKSTVLLKVGKRKYYKIRVQDKTREKL